MTASLSGKASASKAERSWLETGAVSQGTGRSLNAVKRPAVNRKILVRIQGDQSDRKAV